MKSLIKELTYTRWFAWLFHYPAVYFGALVFRRSGSTPWLSFWSMRRLYCATRGRFNRSFSRGLETAVQTAEAPAFDEQALEKLRRDGFAVLGRRLDEGT